jgi:hypothetical protein
MCVCVCVCVWGCVESPYVVRQNYLGTACVCVCVCVCVCAAPPLVGEVTEFDTQPPLPVTGTWHRSLLTTRCSHVRVALS